MPDSQVTADITVIISAGKSLTVVTKIKYFILFNQTGKTEAQSMFGLDVSRRANDLKTFEDPWS